MSRKRIQGSKFFLRMATASEETLATEARELWREPRAILNPIFGAIWRKYTAIKAENRN